MTSRTILIAGAGSGIAQSLVDLLQSDGDSVVTWSRSASGDEVVDGYSGKLPDPPGIVDGLVYFPGTLKLTPFPRISLDKFREDWEVNVGGFINVLHRTLPGLQKGNQPSVVGISSVAVRTGLPFHATVGQAKGGLEGLIRSLAAEYAAKGIRFNAVAPSLTETNLTSSFVNSDEKRARMDERHPLGRVGQPGDVAEAIRFLLSEKSTWITGQIIGVDGGFGATRP